MRQHSIRPIPQQHNLPIQKRSRFQQLPIIQPPLPYPLVPTLNHFLHSGVPAFVLFRHFSSAGTTRPTLFQIAQLPLRFTHKRNHIQRFVLTDGKHEEVFVWREPGDCAGREGPEGCDGGEREEPAVGDAAAVAGGVVGDELGPDGGVDSVGADDEVCGCGGAVGEGDGDEGCVRGVFLLDC